MTTESTLEKQADQETPAAEPTHGGRFFRPNVDIVEKNDELVLLADMPGAKSDEIDIRFEDGELTVHGRVAPRNEERTNMLLAEYGMGDFFRTFRVGEKIDASRIRAEYANGVLTLHLPKSEAAKPRKIAVQTA